MTLRQTLTAWFRFLWLGLLAIGVFASSWRDNGYNHFLRIGVLTFLIVTVFGLFAFGFRCPRCRISLAPKASHVLRTGPYACPRCGASMDEKPGP
jgi:protein-S-isoprenylcysteine O-methyltransferase Ste14